MPRKSEQVLAAVFDLIRANAPEGMIVLRNEPLPQKIPAAGIAILHDGDPGDPAITMSPVLYEYDHAAELDVFVQGATPEDRGVAFDTIMQAIGAALESDRQLNGLAQYVRPLAPVPRDLPIEGAAPLAFATVPIVASYTTTDPLL